MFEKEQSVRPGLVGNGHRQMDFEIGKGIDGAIGRRRVGRTDHVRIGPERAFLNAKSARRLRGADEFQRRVIFVMMKISLRERGAAGEGGILKISRIIITAKRKGPDLVDFRAATGWRQITPGNSAFEGPAFVAVLPMIEGTIHYDSGVDVKLALIFEPRNRASAA